jgi:hypothetical protein
MEERVNRVPAAKSWADEIDDLYHDATERSLREMQGAHARRLVRDPGGTDDRLPGADSAQRVTSAGVIPR